MNNTTVIHIVCQHCQAINRLPEDHLSTKARCGKCHQYLFNSQPTELTSQSFKRHISHNDIPVLVDFWAPWCGPCKMIGPIVEELAVEYEGKAKLGKINVDDNQELAGQFGIRGIPTVMIFKNGQVAASFVGLRSKADLAAALDELV